MGHKLARRLLIGGPHHLTETPLDGAPKYDDVVVMPAHTMHSVIMAENCRPEVFMPHHFYRCINKVQLISQDKEYYIYTYEGQKMK